MQFLSTIIMVLAAIAFLVGIVALFKPLPQYDLPDRKAAGSMVTGSIVIFFIGLIIAPANDNAETNTAGNETESSSPFAKVDPKASRQDVIKEWLHEAAKLVNFCVINGAEIPESTGLLSPPSPYICSELKRMKPLPELFSTPELDDYFTTSAGMVSVSQAAYDAGYRGRKAYDDGRPIDAAAMLAQRDEALKELDKILSKLNKIAEIIAKKEKLGEGGFTVRYKL